MSDIQRIEHGMFRIGDLIWIVDTHTGDGHHTFKRLEDAFAYVFKSHKNCTVTAVSPRGEKMFQTELTE